MAKQSLGKRPTSLFCTVLALAVVFALSAPRLAAQGAEQTPADVVFGLDLAKEGAAACNFTFSDSDKAALDRELASRIAEGKLSAARAADIDAQARTAIADRKTKEPGLCAPNGDFYGLVRELFDASADNPHR
jgi:hypothetical protein